MAGERAMAALLEALYRFIRYGNTDAELALAQARGWRSAEESVTWENATSLGGPGACQ